jgi:hypothetical protein
MKFDQAYCQDLLTKILQKFISYFPSFILFSMHFRILNEFLQFINENQNLGKGNWVNSTKPKSDPRPHYAALA